MSHVCSAELDLQLAQASPFAAGIAFGWTAGVSPASRQGAGPCFVTPFQHHSLVDFNPEILKEVCHKVAS